MIENHRTIHTLFMGDDSEILFNVLGSIEFFNDDNSLRKIMDNFSFWRMYVEYCAEKGIEPDTGLRF